MALEHKHQRSEDEHPQSSLPTITIPTEIIVEILLKLPTVNSLLRCKSVCKSWRSLISDPHFIKSHLAISTSNNNHYAHHRLVFSTRWSTMLKSCTLYDLLYDSSAASALNIDDFPFKHHRDTVAVVGSCNGLVCVAVEGYVLYIWNPSTRKSNRLPPSDYKKKLGYVPYGFGYQESTDDYKVVELYREFNDKREIFVKIYSLKTGNWKTIGVFPHRFSFTCRGNFSNGAFHWAAKKSSESWTIVSLDLANETYGEFRNSELR
ncbi:F-box/kelch-repeat protein At3g23880-like [Bidens hawaiensis]|uniref:F-box/kelch-repeat protein At3g23880-like n=1 Tax=Bidens hawaiensis TaxID=980011 RepID=UPI00404986A6